MKQDLMELISAMPTIETHFRKFEPVEGYVFHLENLYMMILNLLSGRKLLNLNCKKYMIELMIHIFGI